MNKKNNKICILVPCFNEGKSISQFIDELSTTFPNYHIIIVNDGSTDNSAAIIKQNGKAELLDLPVNLGIGGGVQTGFKYAKRNGYDILLRLDGDGQHPARFGEKLIQPLLDGEADITIGSRFVEESGAFRSTSIRRIGIKWFRFLNNLLIKQDITDSTSGFRAYNSKLINFLADNYPAFDYPEPEEIILLGKNNFKIKEISVEMKERESGKSSITSLKSVYYMLKVSFAIFMIAIRPKSDFMELNNYE